MATASHRCTNDNMWDEEIAAHRLPAVLNLPMIKSLMLIDYDWRQAIPMVWIGRNAIARRSPRDQAVPVMDEFCSVPRLRF